MANVYYKRVLSDRMIDIIKDPKYSWIIDYVKQHPELDFQTGSNAKGTWFSVYRGTGRILLAPTAKDFMANPAASNSANSESQSKTQTKSNIGKVFGIVSDVIDILT